MNEEVEKEKSSEIQKNAIIEETKKSSELEETCEKAQIESLPQNVRNGKETISSKDLERLHSIFCGSTDKMYDSDDSIISNIDNMDAEELANGSRKMKQNFEIMKRLALDSKSIDKLFKIKENKKKSNEKEKIDEGEMKKNGEQIEKNASEKKRKKKNGSFAEMIEEERKCVQIFVENDQDETKYMKSSTFAKVLEIFEELIADEAESLKHKQNVENVNNEKISEELLLRGIENQSFFMEEWPLIEYLKIVIERIFDEPKIAEIFNSKKYGFEMNTKECLQALQKYYRMTKIENDNGKSIKSLEIDRINLIKSCYMVKRSENRYFEPNNLIRNIVLSP